MEELLVNVIPGETRIATLADGCLASLKSERRRTISRVDGIHLGRVVKISKPLRAAFIDIGDAAPGFLPLSEVATESLQQRSGQEKSLGNLTEGQSLVVRVTKEAYARKGAKLTTRLHLVSRRMVLTPGKPGLNLSKRLRNRQERTRLETLMKDIPAADYGVTLRSAAQGSDREQLADEVARLVGELTKIQSLAQDPSAQAPLCLWRAPDLLERTLRDAAPVQRIIIDEAPTLARARRFCRAQAPDLLPALTGHKDPQALFDAFDLESQIEAALSRTVPLPSGGSLIIQQTETACCIDVNSGDRAVVPKGGLAAATNLEAVSEIARQLRLRNLGGAILIDFVPSPDKRRKSDLAERLRQATRTDPTPVHILGHGPLGMIEATRERRGLSLAEVLLAPDGVTISAETAAFNASRAVLGLSGPPRGKAILEVAPAVSRALQDAAKDALDLARRRLGRRLEIRVDEALAPADYRLSTSG